MSFINVLAFYVRLYICYYDSGPWALCVPSRDATSSRLDARFRGTAVAGVRCTLCRQSPLPDPDGSSTSVASGVAPHCSRRCWIILY